MRVPWDPVAGNSPVFGCTENTLVAEATWAVNGTGFLQKHVTLQQVNDFCVHAYFSIEVSLKPTVVSLLSPWASMTIISSGLLSNTSTVIGNVHTPPAMPLTSNSTVHLQRYIIATVII